MSVGASDSPAKRSKLLGSAPASVSTSTNSISRTSRVATTRDGFDQVLVIAQRLAQLRNLKPEVAFLNNSSRPDRSHDLALADYAAARLDENMKDIERPAADTDGSAVSK
jgi:hypothetical protein